MTEKILVPVLGESITEATISKWLKSKGDNINADEPLVELETDKVNLEVPSPINGTLTEINFKDGDTVEFDKTNEWLSSLMELKIAHDPSIAGVYISDEVDKEDKPAKVEVTKTGNVIQFTRGSKDV